MTDEEIIDIGRSFPLLTHLLIEQNSKTTFICAVRACLATQREDDARAIEAARATADRDSVIELCAAVLDRRINGWRARSTAIFSGGILADELDYLACAIRALKSQQDAAIESQSGKGESS